MKAICPGHNGPVDVPVHMADLRSDFKVVVFCCPICEEEVMLSSESFSAYKRGLEELYTEQHV